MATMKCRTSLSHEQWEPAIKKCAYEVDELSPVHTKAWYSGSTSEKFLLRRNHSPITVLLVDDHEVVRAGCRLVLEDTPDIQVVAEASDGESGYLKYKEYAPGVVILDLNMSGIDGWETIRRIKAYDPKARILIFSMHNSESMIQRTLEAGATGYLSKQCCMGEGEMVKAVRDVVQGKLFIDPKFAKSMASGKLFASSQDSLSVLSSREFQIFKMLAEGHATSEIADILSISSKTVGVHHTNIMKKLGFQNTAQIVRLALRCDVIEP